MRAHAAVLLLAALGAGCRSPQANAKERCRNAASTVDEVVGVCLDDTTFFACSSDAEIPCRGAKGCSGARPTTLRNACDVSRDAEGDPCVSSNRHRGQCGADGKSLVECQMAFGKTPRYAIFPCRGPRGCVDEGKAEPTCDDSLGEVGDPCKSGGGCSADHAVLACDRPPFSDQPGRLKVQQRCRGPGGCERIPAAADRNGYSIACDDDIAVEGDPCTFDGIGACNAEGTAHLVCKDHRMQLDRHCKCTAQRTGKHSSSITCAGG